MNSKNQLTNKLRLGVFCSLLGITAGLVIWLFLKIVELGTGFLWEWVPAQLNLPLYTVLLCTLGGLIIGLFRKGFGDYPEDLQVVMGKVKTEKRYEYRNMLVMLVAALLPLLLGSSVGPEAGLTGIIVGLCYWAGENMKLAKQEEQEYSQIGMAVTLSVLFHSPLFGIFSVEETNSEKETVLPRSSKLLLYGLALAGGLGAFLLLSNLWGGVEALPQFPKTELVKWDYLLLLIYILAGCILARFYQLTHHAVGKIVAKIPAVLRETLGGLGLGIVGTLIPVVMFSGEEQMGVLMVSYGNYLPLALIGVAFLKVLLTNVCIQAGLKGGHFFPLIFAGVCLGYGAALLVFPGGGDHLVVAAAVVTAALLGGVLQKPLAVTMLLFLCFPISLFIWIYLAAVVGSKVEQMINNKNMEYISLGNF